MTAYVYYKLSVSMFEDSLTVFGKCTIQPNSTLVFEIEVLEIK